MSILQLDNLVRQHSLPRLVHSAAVRARGGGGLVSRAAARAGHTRSRCVRPASWRRGRSTRPPPPTLAQFLATQLPARLENHVARLQELAPAASPPLRELLSASAGAKLSVLEVGRDAARVFEAGEAPRAFEAGAAATAAQQPHAPHAHAPPPQVARDWALLDTGSLKGLQHFESHLVGLCVGLRGRCV